MRLAIVGTGVSGLVCAHLLRRRHDLTLFEADDRLGGHSHTVLVPRAGGEVPVDTGFIVFNALNYPNLTRLLAELEVPVQDAPMSFSVQCEATGLEYGGGSLAGMFGRWRNLASPALWRLLWDLRRFGRHAREALALPDERRTLAEFLAAGRYSTAFVERYLVPMVAAIWSAPLAQARAFPVRAMVRFFHNHGMLEPWRRPQWRTVVGGARRYVERLVAPLRDRIRLRTPVVRVTRHADAVELTTAAGTRERFDQVVLAVHSDQALAMLGDPAPAEREILGAIPYQGNDTVLHTDARLLPRRRRAWAAWNYHIPRRDPGQVTVTYDLSILQGIPGDEHLCVTLNRTDQIDPARIIRRMRYHHPQYSAAAFAAQRRHAEISGVRRTHYCGAWWGYGFHEDGVNSALVVGRAFGEVL